MNKRDAIFISHANPEDNLFSRWFSLQLIKLGYDVWCDVINLKGGEDFWEEIEKEIRENSCVYIYVLSKISNAKEGPKKELAVATRVKKQLEDSDFIIPIIIDNILYDNINIELNRLNSINFFEDGWAVGFKKLLDKLKDKQVSKDNNNFLKVKEYWENIYLKSNQLLIHDEVYLSNWFPIQSFPKTLNFHDFRNIMRSDFDINKLKYPAIKYKERLATFAWCYDFVEELPDTYNYIQKNTHEIKVQEILTGNYHDDFISNKEAKRMIISLLNWGFKKTMQSKKLMSYSFSNQRYAYWYQAEALEKNKYNSELLVGKQKNKKWHFAIDGYTKLYPLPCFGISSHILFSNEGREAIDSNSIQHRSRRKQGRNWWNDKWRNKLNAFVASISNDRGEIEIELGSEEKLIVSDKSLQFISPVSYIQPSHLRDNLGEDWIEDDVEENIIDESNDEDTE